MDTCAVEIESAPPCVFVLMGATGDLAARKIAPALCNLHNAGKLDKNFAIVAVGRKEKSDSQYRQEFADAVQKFNLACRNASSQSADKLAEKIYYQRLEATNGAVYKALGDRLSAIEKLHATGGNRMFYLAVGPELFGPIADNLAASGLCRCGQSDPWTRLVIEKPFGRDLQSATELNSRLLAGFDESQIFRIDHYLGKETVQNLLVFRFANAIFEPLMNNRFVESVEITTAEQVGMEDRRGAYYETAGALRDMIQSHMLQLLALVAMDAPSCLRCGQIRQRKSQLLSQLVTMTPQQVASQTVRGQYSAGAYGPAYTQETGVAGNSQIETFAAVRADIDNPRWSGVPFYLRTGKRLAKKVSQIVIHFRQSGLEVPAGPCLNNGPNRLIIRIFPDEGISVIFDVKVPGKMMLRPKKLDFSYQSAFDSASPEAYENLLLDAMAGETTMFIHWDEVVASWRFVDAIRNAWDSPAGPPLHKYAPLTWGPEQAHSIFGDAYRKWHPTQEAEK